MKSNLAKKTTEQCFLGKTKPTCQNLAIFEHFQNSRKIKGTFLPAAFQLEVFGSMSNLSQKNTTVNLCFLLHGEMKKLI